MTGRARRCGWFDAVLVRQTVKTSGIDGIALTKLDGTARGGVVVAVNQETGLPVKLVGLGEGIDDLRDFEPEAFVDGLLGEAPGR